MDKVCVKCGSELYVEKVSLKLEKEGDAHTRLKYNRSWHKNLCITCKELFLVVVEKIIREFFKE